MEQGGVVRSSLYQWYMAALIIGAVFIVIAFALIAFFVVRRIRNKGLTFSVQTLKYSKPNMYDGSFSDDTSLFVEDDDIVAD